MGWSPEKMAEVAARNEKIVALWNSGLSAVAISQRLRCHTVAVYDALNAAGVERTGHRFYVAGTEGGAGSKTRAGNYVRRT